MARPRVFISSTYYDLKHVRSSLQAFVNNFGFDAVLFEEGSIAFDPGYALDLSCYREAQSADIFVLIIGGRYGSASSNTSQIKDDETRLHYNSITKHEFEAAQGADVPTFILVDSAVHAEYETFKKNRDNSAIAYAHVDSTGVFRFIDDVYALRRNNPVHTFDKISDITDWLQSQWVGLFKSLLQDRRRERQLGEIRDQVAKLESANEIMKNYLEALVRKANVENSEDMIESSRESEKQLKNKSMTANTIKHSSGNSIYKIAIEAGARYDRVVDFFVYPQNENEVKVVWKSLVGQSLSYVMDNDVAQSHYNETRRALNLEEVKFTSA